MSAWLTIISGSIQIALIWLANRAESVKQEREKKDALINAWHKARESSDRSAMLDILDQLRRK